MNFSEPTIKVLKIIQKTNPELLSVEESYILEKNAGSVTAINPEPAKQDTNRLRKGFTNEY